MDQSSGGTFSTTSGTAVRLLADLLTHGIFLPIQRPLFLLGDVAAVLAAHGALFPPYLAIVPVQFRRLPPQSYVGEKVLPVLPFLQTRRWHLRQRQHGKAIERRQPLGGACRVS